MLRLGAAAAGTSGGGGGGGGSVTLTPGTWTDIYATGIGITNALTFSGFTGLDSVTATNSGSGLLASCKNGANYGVNYTGAFTMAPGDTLAWMVNQPADGSSCSGTITVTDATNSVVLGTFTYLITGTG